jgi:hypothetical protein
VEGRLCWAVDVQSRQWGRKVRGLLLPLEVPVPTYMDNDHAIGDSSAAASSRKETTIFL